MDGRALRVVPWGSADSPHCEYEVFDGDARIGWASHLDDGRVFGSPNNGPEGEAAFEAVTHWVKQCAEACVDPRTGRFVVDGCAAAWKAR